MTNCFLFFLIFSCVSLCLLPARALAVEENVQRTLKGEQICHFLRYMYKYDYQRYPQSRNYRKFCDEKTASMFFPALMPKLKKCTAVAAVMEQMHLWGEEEHLPIASEDFNMCGCTSQKWWDSFKNHIVDHDGAPETLTFPKGTSITPHQKMTESFKHAVKSATAYTAAAEIVRPAQTLKLSLLTWNTEYYHPKEADFRAILKANGKTWDEVCQTHSLVLVLQEVHASPKYVDTDTYAQVAQKLKAELTTACGDAHNWDADSVVENPLSMEGTFGTKNKFNGGSEWFGVNSQVLICFHRPQYDAEEFIVSTKGEKGGVMVRIHRRSHPEASALVVGVHLEVEQAKRDSQIFNIFKKAIEQVSKSAWQNAGIDSTKTENWKQRMSVLLQNFYKHGVFWLGDSNFRADPSAVGLGDVPGKAYKKPKGKRFRSPTAEQMNAYKTHLETYANTFSEHLAKIACEEDNAVHDLIQADSNLDPEANALMAMGAQISKPYPALPPSYPWIDQQPLHLQNLERREDDSHVQRGFNEKAKNFIDAWSAARDVKGHCTDNVRGELTTAIKEGLELSLVPGEILKLKHHLLNFGYLDRLFMITHPLAQPMLKVEVEGVIPGGDHLPVLFVAQSTFPATDEIDDDLRSAELSAWSHSSTPVPWGDVNMIAADSVFLTSVYYTNGQEPDHVEFKPSTVFSATERDQGEARVTTTADDPSTTAPRQSNDVPQVDRASTALQPVPLEYDDITR